MVNFFANGSLKSRVLNILSVENICWPCKKFLLFVADLGIGGEGCKKTKTKIWIGKHVTGTAKTELHTVLVERGLSWAEIQEKWAELTGDLEGFYLSHQVSFPQF